MSWDEFLEWQAFSEVEPFGEQRQDARQAVLVSYLLAPYMPSDSSADLPEITWPYWPDEDAFDPAAAQAAMAEHRTKWDKIERNRLEGSNDTDSTDSDSVPSCG